MGRFAVVAAVAIAGLVVACGSSNDNSGGSGGSSGSSGSGGSGGSGAASGGSGGTGATTACGGEPTHSGEGTYYDATGAGNCSFEATPNDLMVAAMNHTDYADSAACGACVRVAGPKGEVTVRIVDRCPECPAGDVDLSPQAFEQIAELSAGRVPITWQYVPCGVSGPIAYRFKEGSNQWWTAVQIRNHRHAIAKLEVDEGSGFVEVPRLDYNYFVDEGGMGPGPYTFRVTDVYGHELVDTNVPHQEAQIVSGSAQFPECAK